MYKKALEDINCLKHYNESNKIHTTVSVDLRVNYKKPNYITKKSIYESGNGAQGVYVWYSKDLNDKKLYTGSSSINKDSSIDGRTKQHIASIHHAILESNHSSAEHSGPKFIEFMKENKLKKATFSIKYLDLSDYPMGTELFYEQQLIQIFKTPLNKEFYNKKAANRKKPIKATLDQFLS